MEYSQAVRYAIFAANHSGADSGLWLRYLEKWVTPSGNIFSARDIADIRGARELTQLQKVMLIEAVTPGTPTNRYIAKQRVPRSQEEMRERERRLISGEETY